MECSVTGGGASEWRFVLLLSLQRECMFQVVTPAGGIAFLVGSDLWWFYSDDDGKTVRGFWNGCFGCGFFRTDDGRVRCPAGAFLNGDSCRQVTYSVLGRVGLLKRIL